MRQNFLEAVHFGEGELIRVDSSGKLGDWKLKNREFSLLEVGLGGLMISRFLWAQCTPKSVSHDLAAGFRERELAELGRAEKLDDIPTSPLFDYDLQDILERDRSSADALIRGVEAMSALNDRSDFDALLFRIQGNTAYTATDGRFLHLANFTTMLPLTDN